MLWLGTKLSHEYDGFVTANIKYNNIPEDYILSGSTTNNITLHIRTKGFYLLTEKLKGRRRVVEVNASLLPLNKEYISDEAMKNILLANLNKYYTLISIQPDTFFYDFDKKYSKKVPVKFNAELDFEQQYGLTENPKIEPKEVVVSGPRKVINDLEFAETNMLQFSKIKSNLQGKVKLKNVAANTISFEPEIINYSIQVEKYTEQIIEVPVRIINVPARTNIVIFPKKIKVSCMVSLTDYEKVTEDLFEAVADFSKINITNDKLVGIQIKRKPAFVKNINYTPKKAEFIINR